MIATPIIVGSISAGTTLGTLGDVVFSNSNNITFGMSGQTMTAIAGSNDAVNFSAGTLSNNLASVVFSNSNGVSFGLNGSTITATVQTNYLTTAMLSNAVTLSNVNISAGTLSNNLSAWVLSNSNGVSFGLSGSTVTATVATNYQSQGAYLTTAMLSNAATISNVNVSAAGSSNNLSAMVFSNSNNVSFGLTGSTITATAGAGNVNFSVVGSSVNLTAIVLSNSNNATFGLNGSTVTISSPISISAGASNGNFTNIVFSNSNDINFGLNGNTITAQGAFISSYENIAIESSVTLTLTVNTLSHGAAFLLPMNGSFSFLRIPGLMTTNSTTLATTAQSMSASAALFSTLNAVVYSMGSGASSRSLMSVASGSNGWTMMNSISVATNGTQYSITQGVSFNAQGGGTTRTTQYSISNTNISLTTNQIATEWSGGRWLDINFANSLSPGAYWLLFGISTTSSTGGDANASAFTGGTNCNVRYSNHYGASQPNAGFGVMGSTNNSSGGYWGAGSFSTAGGGTTANLPISALSTSVNNVRLYFQLLRSA